MGTRCFLCGESVEDGEKLLSITTESGDYVNLIHRECYDLDSRDYLSRKEILKELSKKYGETYKMNTELYKKLIKIRVLLDENTTKGKQELTNLIKELEE